MKKLLLLILISFGFTNFSIANEKVNLSCAFYETFHWDTGETSRTSGGGSLIIFPDTGKYMYDGIEGNYQTVGNEIRFSHLRSHMNGRWDYSLDKTTTAFEEAFYLRSDKTKNKFTIRLTHKGKCKKTENLF